MERYLHLVDQGVEVDKIAAVTFTKKAAQEMKDRLRQERPDLVEKLEYAQISTIHSLCQRIIAEHPLQARIDPRFRVGEEWETRILLTEVIEEVVRESEAPEALGTAREIGAVVLELYQAMLRKGDLQFDPPLPRRKPNFLETAAARCPGCPALKPQTEVQKRILGELGRSGPVSGNVLFFR